MGIFILRLFIVVYRLVTLILLSGVAGFHPVGGEGVKLPHLTTKLPLLAAS